jgi:hypothetical protein
MERRGRPFEPGNKLGRGRPRGSRNKTIVLAQEMLQSRAPEIVNKCLELALQGDAVALRLCLERVAPVRSKRPVNLGALPMGTVAELSQASDLVLRKVISGELTIVEARGIAAHHGPPQGPFDRRRGKARGGTVPQDASPGRRETARAEQGRFSPRCLKKDRLETALFGGPPRTRPGASAMPDFAELDQQRQVHPPLTQQLLWEDYRQANPDGYRSRVSASCLSAGAGSRTWCAPGTQGRREAVCRLGENHYPDLRPSRRSRAAGASIRCRIESERSKRKP